MPHPFPPLTPPEPARTRPRIHALPPPSLPWGEALIVLTIGLILLQI